jgi:hypothetical protein
MFENTRKFDLIRWGIYVSTMQAAGAQVQADGIPPSLSNIGHVIAWWKNTQEKHVLLPIPAQELNNNKLLTQNPGWN